MHKENKEIERIHLSPLSVLRKVPGGLPYDKGRDARLKF